MATFYNDDLRMRPTQETSSSSSDLPPTPPPSTPSSSASLNNNNDPSSDDVSAAISWPIALAVVPTLGAFFAGSADVWSDFVMSLLFLYYVYKWMTVPWSYFEGARARRIIHQNASANCDEVKQLELGQKLRHEERVGLFWVMLSPFIVAYSLRFSRYFLTNHERYMNYFNIGIFVLAAMVKPCDYALSQLRDRTQELQDALGPDEQISDVLQSRVDQMYKEINDLYGELATKKDVGAIASEFNPAVEKIAKAAKRMERKEAKYKETAEERFSVINDKVDSLNQLIVYRIEQDQRQSSQRTFVTLMFLPVNIGLWAAKNMTGWLPIHVPLLSSALPSPLLSAVIESHNDGLVVPPPSNELQELAGSSSF